MGADISEIDMNRLRNSRFFWLIIQFLLAGGFLLGFVLFTWLVRRGTLTQLDFDIVVKIQDRLPERAYEVLSWTGALGSFAFTTILLFIALLWRRTWHDWVFLFTYGAGLLLAWWVREKLEHPAPMFMFYKASEAFDHSKYYVHTEYSYPSGHSYRWIFLMCLLFLWTFTTKRTNLVIIFFRLAIVGSAFLVLFAKVALGEHWTTDVTGGALLAMGTVLMTSMLLHLARVWRGRYLKIQSTLLVH